MTESADSDRERLRAFVGERFKWDEPDHPLNGQTGIVANARGDYGDVLLDLRWAAVDAVAVSGITTRTLRDFQQYARPVKVTEQPIREVPS